MAKGVSVSVDVNQAIDQAERLADRLWDGFASEATNVVVAVANNTQWKLRHLGGFQWQGITTEPAKDIAAGEPGGWRTYSTGLDGAFSMQTWELQWPGRVKLYLNVGELVYATRSQPKFTALFGPINLLTNDSNNEKDRALALLDKGHSTGRTQDMIFPGPGQHDATSFELRTLVTGPKIEDISYGFTYLVTLNEIQR